MTVLYPFAQRAAVLEDMGVIESIGRGWQVIKENLGEVIILLLLFLLLGLLVGLATLAVFIPLAALFFAPYCSEDDWRRYDRSFGYRFGIWRSVMHDLDRRSNQCHLRGLSASTVFTLAYGEFTSKKAVS